MAEREDDGARRERCRKLLAELRKHCPELLPRAPLQPGALAPAVPLPGEQVEALVREALAPHGKERVVVWRDADSEIALHTARTRVVVGDGVVAVALLLECEEAGGPVEVVVPFGVGAEARPAGMLAATERRPRGPAVVVDRWGEAILATAWEALLEVAAVTAAAAGRDVGGEPLRAGALLAAPGSLAVVPQARHPQELQAGR